MSEQSSYASSTFLYTQALDLLSSLIAIPSFSREEQATADRIVEFLSERGLTAQRKGNNVWLSNRYFNPALPTILLNSHHDTVKPAASYTVDPFEPRIEADRLYGLGSNDAGGALVSLLMCFLHFYERKDLAYNLIFAATAEEEISGTGGIASILEELGSIDFAIVGEPTLMDMAIAEKGLLVLDCTASGTSAHAAHAAPDNAIINAMQDIAWFQSYRFPKMSATLGDIRMNVTMIAAGAQHNLIPDTCRFTVDIRTTDAYTNQEVLAIVEEHVQSAVNPRSSRLNPSSIAADHPIVIAGKALGRQTYGSPTISDQALMPFPSLKMGPGDSLRSHTSDEFIWLEEIASGIGLYIALLSKII